MKICHVIDNMFLDRGGPVAVVAGLAGAQAARGDDVSVLCRSRLRHGELLGEEHALDPRIIVVEMEPLGSASRKSVSAALEALAPDMLHVHGVWEKLQRQATSWARTHQIPWVLSTHGMMHPVPLSHGWFKKRAYLLLLGGAVRGARRLLVTSEEERTFASRMTGRPSVFVPNGVPMLSDDCSDPSMFRRSVPTLGDAPYLLFLGRIHEIKGLDKLVRAYAAALGEGMDADLVLAGPEDGFGAEVRRVAQASGVTMRVHFAGAVYGARKVSALAGCVAFVHRPNYEGFGMTVVEAMAAGRPAITTGVCGVARACPPDVMIIAPDTDEGFGEAMANGLAHRADLEAMARRGAEWVRTALSWQTIAAQVMQAYA
jgi:glycosyltransferase involved in cell wall biosynthesis